MKKRGAELIIIAVVLGLILVSFYFDDQIVHAISAIRTGYLNDFFLGIAFISSEIIIFFILTSLFLFQEHKRKWIFPLWLSLAFTTIVSFLLKIIIQRQRPFQSGVVSTLPILVKPDFITWNFSFPSFQAAMAFCALPILNKEFPRFKYVWFLFALLVAFSRVYFGLHFMSDVLAGGLIGYAIGLLIVGMENKNRTWSRIYEKIVYGEK